MRYASLALALAVAVTGSTTSQADAPAPAGLSYTIETVAGGSDVGDGGPAIIASLSDAQGVTVDAAGNVFVSDANDHRVRGIAPDGTISTVAGDGSRGFRGDGGPASAARLNTPYGIAVDRAGNLYIADLGNHRVRKMGPDGTITTVPGTEKLLAPRNVALDASGVLYISEFAGHRVWRLRSDGVVETVAGNGVPGFSGDGGPAAAAQLSSPAGLAFDSAGNLYIADSGNQRVRKVAGGVITTVMGSDGPGAVPGTQLDLPTSVAVDRAGNLYAADSGNLRIQFLTPTGDLRTLPGFGRDLALDVAGNLLIASGDRVLELTPALVIQTLAGDRSYPYRGDGGPATSARLSGPVAVALDSAGRLYIADRQNQRIRNVDKTGVIATTLGDGSVGPGSGQLSYPAGVAVDPLGAVYISDQDNHRIQEITTAGNIVTLAGTGSPGFNGDGLPPAVTQLFSPGAMALAANGTLYFADAGNHRVRSLSPAGVVSTVAQIAARGVAVDGAGNVYVSDGDLHRVVRIGPQGHSAVLSGSGAAGFAGDGGPALSAQLSSPTGLAVDAQANVYIADTGNNRIRVIGPDGNIRTIAGAGAADFDGDGGPALSAAFNSPAGLAVDAAGNLWIADTANNRIRKLTPVPIAAVQSELPTVVNAASMLPGPVAPGEIVAIFGRGLGPVTPAGATLDASGVLATELAHTRVFFNGVAAPLFYAQDSQVNAQVPFEIARQTTVDMEIFFQGVLRRKAKLPVAPAAPGIFTISSGAGMALAINQNGTLNSPIQPAPRESVIVLYATGQGLTHPASIDGEPATAPFPTPTLPVVLSVGGYPVDILFAGAAPGYSGLLQINARVPGGFFPTGNVPVVLQVGAAFSQPAVTIAVR
jgi:uncharacterized protein (TIGR03437 family)